MGSSPSPSDFQRLEKDDGPVINCGELMALFESQERHLHDFFHNLDVEQAQTFAQALLEAPGAVFFSGVGNSGLVALTLSQTLASLGFTRSAYLSPVDALHGNIGSLFPSDILVLISKTGSSEELLNLVPCARAKGARLISITSVKGNPLASRCDMNVHLPLEGGVCPFGLAPLTSSTIQIVFGHTVMAALMRAGKLTKENYARNHPAGKIGKSLIFKLAESGNASNHLIVQNFLRTVVHNEQEAYENYCAYAHHIGFTVRKDHSSFWPNSKKIKTKDYLCGKAGHKRELKMFDTVKYRKADTRTGCQAMVRYAVDVEGNWTVKKFIESHNHPLAETNKLRNFGGREFCARKQIKHYKVKHLMKKQDELPLCKETDMIMDQLTELTSKACGCLLVVNAENQLIGTFTDGDLRRTLKASGEGIFKLTVGEMCNRKPRTIRPEEMAADAMKKMESPPSAVQFLPVIDDRRVVVGIITLHGLVSAGL